MTVDDRCCHLLGGGESRIKLMISMTTSVDSWISGALGKKMMLDLLRKIVERENEI
jgi:hypothetical protein